MPLTLSPRSPISIPVEVEAVLPETTRGLSLADVSRLPITQATLRCVWRIYSGSMGLPTICSTSGTAIFRP